MIGNGGGEKSFTSNACGHIISMITYERGWDLGKDSWFIQTHKSSKGGGYPVFSWTLVGISHAIIVFVIVQWSKSINSSIYAHSRKPYGMTRRVACKTGLSYTWLNTHGGKEHCGELKHLKEETIKQWAPRDTWIYILLKT